MRLSTKIFNGFFIILILSIIGSFVGIKFYDDVTRNTEFLTNSESIVRNSTRLHKKIIEMQSAFRGYLLAGNDDFLAAYREGLRDVPALFDIEKKLLINSFGQLQKLDSIQLLHRQWTNFADELIDAKSNLSEGKNKYNLLLENKFRSKFGQKINDRISTTFKEFERYEYKIREQRRALLAASIKTTRIISITLILVIAIIGLVSALFITHIISQRISHMVDIAARISRGEFNIIEDKKNDELTKLSQSLILMSNTLHKNFTDLERKNKELDQFAQIVSHDLKAPLRGMNNIFEWIEEDLGTELSESLKKYHILIKERIKRMESLITGLLEYARIGRDEKKFESVSIESLLKEVVELIVPDNFNVTIKNKMPVIVAEKLRLEQVFSNIISNSIKFHKEAQGKIEIFHKDLGMYHEFSVIDDGIGIDPEHHKKIFTIFQTLRSKNEKQSTGIGLAIVKKIIDEQKGEIKIISEKDKGLSFTFTWPKQPVE
jgi:signal transduction histidine kinase